MTPPGAAVTVSGVLMYAHAAWDAMREGGEPEEVIFKWPLWKIMWHRAGMLTSLLFINAGVMM